MSLFSRGERPAESRQWVPEPIIPPFPGVNSSGSGLLSPSSGEALQVSAVWACVRLIASALRMMPVSAFTWKDNVRVPQSTPRLLQMPTDARTPFSSFIYQVMMSLLLRGNAYLRIVGTDQFGYPTQFQMLHPDKVTVVRDNKTGLLSFRVGSTVYTPNDIWHIKANEFPGLDAGLSPIQFAATTIRTNEAVGEFAYGFFRDGAHPSAILTSPSALTDEKATSLKARFRESISGREPTVLSGGIEYKPIQINPNESQFLETQKYGVAEICRIFGVPPEMVAADATHSMTYANVEQRSLDFLTYTVQPWISLLEDTFALMLPAQQHIRFDTSVLTRTDYESLMKASAIGIASKQMTPDEARAKRDEPPLTDAQKALLDLVPMDVSATGLPRLRPAAIANPDIPV